MKSDRLVIKEYWLRIGSTLQQLSLEGSEDLFVGYKWCTCRMIQILFRKVNHMQSYFYGIRSLGKLID